MYSWPRRYPPLVRVLIAPNAFKGSASARVAADAIARGVCAARDDAMIDLCPISDGGDGLVDVLHDALGGSIRAASVKGPLGESVSARFLLIDGTTAVIEMAEASGLTLIAAHRRDPMRTSTFGTGELIGAALDAGATRLVIGLGGSATNDGGTGMAAALGVRFLGADGDAIEPCGGTLAAIRSIDATGLDERVRAASIEAAFDVHNALLGPAGAARVYGPQKGATPKIVDALDAGLANLANVIESDLGVSVRMAEGAGAAGGLGAGVVAFLGGELRQGAALVLDLLAVDDRLERADLVITGEGRLDDSSLHGKAPVSIARRARAAGVESVAIVGSHVASPATREAFDGIIELRRDGESDEDAMRETTSRLETAGRAAVERATP